MSPLIDVTNIVIPDISENVQISLSKSSPSNEPKNIEDLSPFSAEDTHQESKITKETPPTTKCNMVKLPHTKRKKVSIRRLFRSSESKISSSLLMTPKQEPNHRVPPLPSDDLLSHALESLNISTRKFEGSILACHKDCNMQEEKNVKTNSKSKLTGSSNNIGPPPDSFASTYNCVACGLELSSVENLTSHLLRHIYEGLYAASWLNNAMSTLLCPSSSEVNLLATNKLHTKHVSSESSVTPESSADDNSPSNLSNPNA